MSALHTQAKKAGISREWQDASGTRRVVADADLRAVLSALGDDAADATPPPLLTAWVGGVVRLKGRAGPCRLTLESGRVIETHAEAAPGGARIQAPEEPGYHQLEHQGNKVTLAVAPHRAYSLRDAGDGDRLWGLAV